MQIRKTRTSFLLSSVLMLAVAPTTYGTQSVEQSWEWRLVEHFDGYCYRTEANFDTATTIAESAGKQQIPDSMMQAFGPMAGDKGKGYVLEVDRPESKAILLAVSPQPGSCGIAGTGLDNDRIERLMTNNFRLHEMGRDDLGMQTTTMYVPDGQAGTKAEAHENGIIAITTPKSETNQVISIGYIPPETAKQEF